MPRSCRLQLSQASNRTAACWGPVDDGSFQERYYPAAFMGRRRRCFRPSATKRRRSAAATTRVNREVLSTEETGVRGLCTGRSARTASWPKPSSSSRPRSSGRFSVGHPALLELRLAADAITAPLQTSTKPKRWRDALKREGIKTSLLHYLPSGLKPARTSSEKISAVPMLQSVRLSSLL
jgi:hypothetical protein